jgi:hypothetical protein
MGVDSLMKDRVEGPKVPPYQPSSALGSPLGYSSRCRLFRSSR